MSCVPPDNNCVQALCISSWQVCLLDNSYVQALCISSWFVCLLLIHSNTVNERLVCVPSDNNYVQALCSISSWLACLLTELTFLCANRPFFIFNRSTSMQPHARYLLGVHESNYDLIIIKFSVLCTHWLVQKGVLLQHPMTTHSKYRLLNPKQRQVTRHWCGALHALPI